jgi:hypothetical protein
MSSYQRTSTTDGTSPMTHVYVSGLVTKGVRVYGTYARADQESRYEEAESLSGDLVSFKISRFFTGRDEVASAKAAADDWRGQLRVEAALGSNFDLVVGYDERHRTLDGSALVESLYTGVSTFTGTSGADITRILDATTLGDRKEEQISARLIARVGRPLTLWAEWAQADQSVEVTPDASEIVVPGNQGGSFDRRLDRLAGGATLKFNRFELGVDFLSDDADKVVMRTDYLDRERLRGRLGFTLFKWLRLSGTAAQITADTAIPGIDYDSETTQYAVDLDVTPSEKFNGRASYSTYDTNSTITVRIPQDLSLEPSLYLAEGELFDLEVNAKVAWFGVTLGWSSYDNTGTFGFDFEHAIARLDFDLFKSFGVGVLAESYDYQETELAEIGDYLVKRYGVFLRFRN